MSSTKSFLTNIKCSTWLFETITTKIRLMFFTTCQKSYIYTILTYESRVTTSFILIKANISLTPSIRTLTKTLTSTTLRKFISCTNIKCSKLSSLIPKSRSKFIIIRKYSTTSTIAVTKLLPTKNMNKFSTFL